MTTPLLNRNKLQELCERWNSIFEKFNRSQRFYFLGTVFAALSAFCYITPFNDIFLVVTVVAGTFLTFGIVSDLLIIYKAVWETVIGKGSLLLLYALSTNTAYGVATRVVNEIVKFESSSLTYTVNFVAILLAPGFIFIGAYAVFAIVLIVGQFYLMFSLSSEQFRNNKLLNAFIPQPKESYPVATFAARFIAFPVVLGFLWSSGKNVGPAYEEFIEKTATLFIYNFEASHFSRCEIDSGSRAIKVNDSEIIAVSRFGNGYSFTPKKCVPIIKP
jgi:hypothetical protein